MTIAAIISGSLIVCLCLAVLITELIINTQELKRNKVLRTMTNNRYKLELNEMGEFIIVDINKRGGGKVKMTY